MVPVNYVAVLACGVAAMVIGFVWYGPLFGKQWMALSGIHATPEMRKAASKSYAIMFVGALVMAYVLAHSLEFAWAYGGSMTALSAGLQAGFWNWLGFVAPVTMGAVLWEGRPWKLWALLNSYQLVTMLVMGLILAYWQ